MAFEDAPERIKNYVKDKINDNHKKHEDNRFGVTDLLACPRKVYYRRRTPRPVEFEPAFHFYKGLLFDEDFTSLFPRNQVRVTYRIPPPSNVVISGRIDFIDEDGAIADWKVTDNLYYVQRDGAKEENKKQVLFYAYCQGCTKARLYYMSFGDIEKAEVEVTPDAMAAVLEELTENALYLNNCLSSNEVPAVGKDYNPEYWECQYVKYRNTDKERVVRCEYYDLCYGGG
jgi:CRISPR-associated exonuclease Cas4